jgi:hypothetical protein
VSGPASDRPSDVSTRKNVYPQEGNDELLRDIVRGHAVFVHLLGDIGGLQREQQVRMASRRVDAKRRLDVIHVQHPVNSLAPPIKTRLKNKKKKKKKRQDLQPME